MTSWQHFFDRGSADLRNRKYKSAKSHFARGVKLALDSTDREKVVKSTFQFGMASLLLKQNEEAESALRHILDLIDATEESYPVIFAATCHNLAHIMVQKGNREEALSLLLQAVRKVKTFAKSEPTFAELYCRAAELKAENGHYWEAESLFRGAIDIQVKLHGRNHENTQATVATLVQLLGEQGRIDDAVMAIELYGEDRFAGVARSIQIAKK